MNTPAPVTITEPNEGISMSIAGNTYRTLISGAQTGGAYAVIDMLVPPGGDPGPHAHRGIQEAFYVIEGEVEFVTETQRYTAKTGTYINIPLNGPVHQFKNVSSEMARLTCIATPAGLEDFFAEIARPVANGEFLPPQPPPSPEAMAKIKAIGERYGQEFFPGDYLDGI